MAVTKQVTIKINAKDGVTGVLTRISGAIEDLSYTAQRKFRRITSALFSFKSAVVGLAGSAGLGMLSSSIVATASSVEKMIASLDTLTKGKGVATFKELSNWAAKMPLDTAKTVEAYKSLLAMGLKPTKEQMTALVNATSALGGGIDTLEGIARAMGQIATKGKVSAEELQQLAERGIPAYKILQEELGLTSKQLQNIGNSGITAEQALTALYKGMEKRYSGATERFMQTWDGMIEQLKDYWFKFKQDIANAGIFDYLKASLNYILKLIQSFKEKGDLKQWAKSTSNAMIVGFKYAVKGVLFFINALYKLKAAFLWLKDVINRYFFQYFWKGLEKLTGGLAKLLRLVKMKGAAQSLDEVKNAFSGLSEAAGEVANEANQDFQELLETISRVEEGSKNVWETIEKQAQQSIKNRTKQLVEPQESAFVSGGLEVKPTQPQPKQEDTLWAGMKAGLDSFVKQYQSVAKNMQAVTENIVNSMTEAFTSFFDATSEGFMNLKKLAINILQMISQEIMRMVVRMMVVKTLTSLGFGGVGNLTAATVSANVMHMGGVVGTTFTPKRRVPVTIFENAPRLHNGLKPDEFPAILQKGEEVVPRDTPARQTKIINVLDPSIVGDYLQTQEGEEMILNIIQKNRSVI